MSITILNACTYSWLLIVLFTLLAVPILVLRYLQEGLPYNFAFSAIIGDIALLIIVFVAKEVLGVTGITTEWFNSIPYHIIAAIVGVSVGVIWFRIDRPPQRGDRYHHLVVAPFIVYLMLTLAPVIIFDGSSSQLWEAILLGVVYAGTVIFDQNHDLLNQRAAVKRIWRAKLPNEPQ